MINRKVQKLSSEARERLAGQELTQARGRHKTKTMLTALQYISLASADLSLYTLAEIQENKTAVINKALQIASQDGTEYSSEAWAIAFFHFTKKYKG